MEKVSIIMPTYNCGKFIKQSIDSVLAQTYKDWKLIIVDDCSTDHTYDEIKPYLDEHSNIVYYKLEFNQGAAAARSKAIELADGEYVAFLDSDDIWDPDKLEKQLYFMEQNGYEFSCTGYRLMDEDGESLNVAYLPLKKVDYKCCIRHSDPIGNLTVMYNQKKLGKFVVPSIKKCNDYALWLQVLKRTKYCCGLPEVLATYRSGRTGNVTGNKASKGKYFWQLYHDIEGHNALRSAYEVGCWAFVKGTGIGLKKIHTE